VVFGKVELGGRSSRILGKMGRWTSRTWNRRIHAEQV